MTVAGGWTLDCQHVPLVWSFWTPRASREALSNFRPGPLAEPLLDGAGKLLLLHLDAHAGEPRQFVAIMQFEVPLAVITASSMFSQAESFKLREFLTFLESQPNSNIPSEIILGPHSEEVIFRRIGRRLDRWLGRRKIRQRSIIDESAEFCDYLID